MSSIAILRSKLPQAGSSPLLARILSGALWVVLANVASRGMLMAAMMLTARLLGKAGFGELGIIQGTIAMFESVAVLGMGLTATKHIAQYRKQDRAKVGRVIALTQATTLVAGFAIGLTIYGIAPWLAGAILGAPGLCEPLRIGAGILMLNAVAGGYSGILAGFESFRGMAAANTLTGAITLPLVVGGAAGFGITGALLGLLGVSACNVLLNMILVRRRMRAGKIDGIFRVTRAEWRLLWSFGLPAMGMGIAVAPVNWAVSALLANHDGYSQVGLYSAANQWFSILLFLPGVFTTVFLPLLAGHGGDEDKRNLSKTVGAGIKATLIASVPMAMLAIAAGPWIMDWYGGEYSEAYPLLVVIAITAAVAATQNMLGNALAVIDRMWANFHLNLLWGLVNLATAYVLLEAGYQALALCLAALAAYLVKLLFTAGLVARRFG